MSIIKREKRNWYLAISARCSLNFERQTNRRTIEWNIESGLATWRCRCIESFDWPIRSNAFFIPIGQSNARSALCTYSFMKIRLTKAYSTMRSSNDHEKGKLRPFLSSDFFRVISRWSKSELFMRSIYPTFPMQSRCIYSENVAHRVNAMSVINVPSIFTGSVFVRIADTRYIRAMARPWSKSTERWVLLEQ